MYTDRAGLGQRQSLFNSVLLPAQNAGGQTAPPAKWLVFERRHDAGWANAMANLISQEDTQLLGWGGGWVRRRFLARRNEASWLDWLRPMCY